TVTYKANGGKGNVPADSSAYESGDKVTVKGHGSLTRTGYDFLGWATNKNASKAKYAAGDTITVADSNITLYAVWKKVGSDKPPVIDPPVVVPPVSPTPPAVVTTPPAVEDPTEPPAEEEPIAEEPPAIDPPAPSTDTEVTEEEPAVPEESAVVLEGFSQDDQAKIRKQTGNVVTDIFRNNVPQGSFSATGVWSVLSLLFSLAAVIISLILIIGAVFRRRQSYGGVYYADAEDEKKRKMKGSLIKIVTIIVGVLTPAVWLILDNLSQPMAWINQYTLIVGIVFLAHLALLIVYNLRKGKSDGTDEREYGKVVAG
ncbi:MAG: InlB B-repeat-containing protein, partial [Clostridiales Family XIII bacterium]|nr:InlB B-repeat-containing protein [Clostridiales Family XIII bacterium]